MVYYPGFGSSFSTVLETLRRLRRGKGTAMKDPGIQSRVMLHTLSLTASIKNRRMTFEGQWG